MEYDKDRQKNKLLNLGRKVCMTGIVLVLLSGESMPLLGLSVLVLLGGLVCIIKGEQL